MGSNKSPLLTTLTGEFYQIARLYYKVYNKNDVIKKLLNLDCVSFNSALDYWEWFYDNEALEIKFKTPFEKISLKQESIILGRIFFKKDGEAYINVNSFDRAVSAVLFFDKHLGKSLFEVTEVEIVNQFFGNYPANSVEIHAEYFDRQPRPRNVMEVSEEKIAEIMSQNVSMEKKRELFMRWQHEESKKPMAKIERLPVHFYEEGINQLENGLKMREVIAMQLWNGNSDYNFHKLIQEIYPSVAANVK